MWAFSTRSVDAYQAFLRGVALHSTFDVDDYHASYEEFEKALKAGGGWQVVKEAGPDVLRVKPKVLNLYVNAPDTKQAGVRTYTLSSGEMTLLLEAYDSETGAILARAIDRRESRNTGQWQLSSSVTNVGDAQQIAATWARILRDRLDKAKAAGKK